MILICRYRRQFSTQNAHSYRDNILARKEKDLYSIWDKDVVMQMRRMWGREVGRLLGE